jgi:hypothetical protein
MAMDVEQVHRFIRGLPKVEEYEHGGLPAFRVHGRRFASMLDDDGVNLMPGDEAIHAAVAEWPDSCREERFGQRLTAVRVNFASLSRAIVEELITEAWRSKAPRTLVHALHGQRAEPPGKL